MLQFFLGGSIVTIPTNIRIDAGSPTTQGEWLAQTAFVSGGSTLNFGVLGAELNLPLLAGRPQTSDATAVYGAYQVDTVPFTYTFAAKDGCVPHGPCFVRVHFIDPLSSGWEQSIKANGSTVIADFVTTAFAGGANIGCIKTFTANADSNAQLVVQVVPGGGASGSICALEMDPSPVVLPYRNFFWVGDSLTAGGGPINATNRYIAYIMPNYTPHNFASLNTYQDPYFDAYKLGFNMTAAGGNTIANQTALINSASLDDYSILYGNAGAHIFCGTNNLIIGDSLATMQSQLAALKTALRNRGVTWMAASTVPPSVQFNPTEESIRLLYNAALKVDTDFAMVVDIAAAFPDPNDPVLFQSDGTHFTPTGQADASVLIAPVPAAWVLTS